MSNNNTALVAGGSGYFGSVLVRVLFENNWHVRILDLNKPEFNPSNDYICGDIRDMGTCLNATDGVTTVFHNVAQVPLSKNYGMFNEVNVRGTDNLVKAAKINKCTAFVYTSSSAIFGVPQKLPIDANSTYTPVDTYGKTKLAGEVICASYYDSTFSVVIVRPRTIIGLNRLGIFGILFGWVKAGLDICILGKGLDKCQFVDARDLAHGIMRAADLKGLHYLNLGSLEFGSVREDLTALCVHARSGSSVIAVPDRLFRAVLAGLIKVRLLPLASYHSSMYSRAIYFDSKPAWAKLGYTPKYSNIESLKESYDLYLKQQSYSKSKSLSPHQRQVEGIGLTLLTLALKSLKKVKTKARGFTRNP